MRVKEPSSIPPVGPTILLHISFRGSNLRPHLSFLLFGGRRRWNPNKIVSFPAGLKVHFLKKRPADNNFVKEGFGWWNHSSILFGHLSSLGHTTFLLTFPGPREKERIRPKNPAAEGKT